MTALDLAKSNELRYKYIKVFVNTRSSHYVKYIKNKIMFSDGLCYTGYLWDCLMDPNIISEYEANQLLQNKRGIYIMWDIHSAERILIPNYWKFPKANVLYTERWRDSFKLELPEDIYIFDESFSWSVIYTHETDSKNDPYCLYTATNKREGLLL